MTNNDMTATELSKALTTKEACEMFIEMRDVCADLFVQFEQLFAHAKALEIEKDVLIKELAAQSAKNQ